MEIITNSEKETKKLAQEFAAKVTYPTVLALYGELGSGKTTFIQGLALGLGITKRILSPTFILHRQFEFGQNHNFHHLDLYRLKDNQTEDHLGLTELFQDSNSIVAIEWPEKIENLLPKNTVRIYFEYVGESERKITIK